MIAVVLSALSTVASIFLFGVQFFLLLALCFCSYILLLRPMEYWKKLGVPQVKLQYPIIGNMLKSFSTPPFKMLEEIYNEHPKDKYVGYFTFLKPDMLVRDPAMIDSMSVKDFAYFSDRGNNDDPSRPLAKHLVNLSGDHWRITRAKLTPTFSSGKMKGMHPILETCANSAVSYMKRFEDGRPFEVRDVIARYTMDVISSCAFGVNIDPASDSNSEFREVGIEFMKPTTLKMFLFFIRPWPQVIQTFIIKLLGDETAKYRNYFVNVIESTMEHRKNNNIYRPDFLELMRELRDSEKDRTDDPFMFDHDSVLSSAFLFYIAGFDTTATAIGHMMYELALNQDVQDKLHKELSKVLEKYGEPSYEAVMEMQYLDQVLSETLRKHPSLPLMARRVTKPYTLPDTNVTIPKGMRMSIPIFAIQHDPQYFPDPEKFLPDRFSPENEKTIKKGTYYPFGNGPRMCIGVRFAKLEIKVLMAQLLMKYKILKNHKTKVPLVFNKNSFFLSAVGGVWVSLEPR